MNTILAVAGVVIKELYRRKDFYVLFTLTAVITLLLGTMRFFNDAQIVRYLKEICLLLIWVSALVIAVGTAARQLPAERESRTILPLLAKPISRAQLLLGKFAGCWLATGLALVVFYAFFGVLAGSRESGWALASYGQALWLHWWMLGVVIALTLMGSVLFSSVAANATICVLAILGILLLARHLNQFALQLSEPLGTIVYALYFALPHLELFDVRDLIIHNWDPIRVWVVLAATAYAAAYTGLFLLAGWLAFRRQALS